MKYKLNQWLWKWHVIAGMVSLPIVLLLSITGGIYLFKVDYEAPIQQSTKQVVPMGTAIPYQQQWEIAKSSMTKKPSAMVVPEGPDHATEFFSGRFGHKTSFFVDPYTAKTSGTIRADEGLMYKVRKLHGELLLGGFGTKIVELVASWMLVLILTGLFIFWPARQRGIQGFFIPRIANGKRLFFRDIHAIGGFWVSGLLLLVLAGAFPWTDVVGGNFKNLQKWTGTGFPKSWNGIGIASEPSDTSVTLDDIVAKANDLNLPGEITISFPKGKNGVYSVGNTYYPELDKQQKFHFDRYSGAQLLHQQWADVGVLMRDRMWVMAFHQGQFGPWNWYLMLGIAVLLTAISISAIFSYLLRKKKGSWGIPKVPKSFTVGYGIVFILILLGVVLPLFGGSLVLIALYTKLGSRGTAALKE